MSDKLAPASPGMGATQPGGVTTLGDASEAVSGDAGGQSGALQLACCPLCGAAVLDDAAHAAYHETLTRVVGRLGHHLGQLVALLSPELGAVSINLGVDVDEPAEASEEAPQ